MDYVWVRVHMQEVLYNHLIHGYYDFFFLAFEMTHLSQENKNIVIWHGCLLIVEVKLYYV